MTLAGKEALSILTGQREGGRRTGKEKEREEWASKRHMGEGDTMVRGLTEERDKRARTERPTLVLRSLFRGTRRRVSEREAKSEKERATIEAQFISGSSRKLATSTEPIFSAHRELICWTFYRKSIGLFDAGYECVLHPRLFAQRSGSIRS